MSGAAIEAPGVTYDALVKSGFMDATIRRANVITSSGCPCQPPCLLVRIPARGPETSTADPQLSRKVGRGHG
jgi:hypothetical protein